MIGALLGLSYVLSGFVYFLVNIRRDRRLPAGLFDVIVVCGVWPVLLALDLGGVLSERWGRFVEWYVPAEEEHS